MPAVSTIDWILAQTLYTQGIPFKDIAHTIKAKEDTVRKRAKRFKWDNQLSKARELMSKVVQEAVLDRTKTIAQRAESWTHETIGDVELTTKELKTLPRPNDLQEYKLHEEVWGMHVKRGRTMFGLDQAAGSVQVNIGLFSGGAGSSGDDRDLPCIDVQAVDKPTDQP